MEIDEQDRQNFWSLDTCLAQVTADIAIEAEVLCLACYSDNSHPPFQIHKTFLNRKKSEIGLTFLNLGLAPLWMKG